MSTLGVMTSVKLNERGSLTLPKRLREKYAMDGDSTVIVEDAGEGILVRPAEVVPVEIYSEARLAEFAGGEAELARYLKSKPGGRK
ncbi:MAG: AbrB/MazE/SpoVT family DNA-binding domain-containing protein [Verrucomicrobia bacterium]|nr:AbrB/MazE/SpoVT family DNA-binding domain-containing protein [Verrucomicrobiota bacterium]